MNKPPDLRLIGGTKESAERSIYRLRAPGGNESRARAIEWPQAGAWRELIHRLMRTPAKSE